MRRLILLSSFALACPGAAELVIPSEPVESISLEPADPAWSKTKPIRVPLVPQRFVAPLGGGASPWVEVASLRTADALLVRLSWPDKTKSARLAPSGVFGDACAVEFPAREGTLPSPFMGEKGAPVNIWSWRAVAQESERYDPAYADFFRAGSIEKTVKFADRPGQSLFAEGFGTITPGRIQDVEGKGVWKEGRWSVVLKRAMGSKEGPTFTAGALVPIAFAVWDGGSEERGSQKSLAFWQTLSLGAGTPRAPASPEARGERVFSRYGCAACHGPGGKGGVKNLNAQGGEVPPINKVKEGFTYEELERVIWEGRASVPEQAKGPQPPLHMFSWKAVISESEMDDLAKYLFSLMPKTEGEGW